ncbi:MAG: glycosyl transferase, family 9 [Candidatus Solibacter sp.]|nr:glycosyl transferase, family 9 [Candidatus Solibacter sp.]
MLPICFSVNTFCVLRDAFSSRFIYPVFSDIRKDGRAYRVDKTRLYGPVFAILKPAMRRLVIRPGAIGDVIVSLPAIESLRADFLEVWTPARTVPLIRFADRVRGISSTGLDLLGITEPPPRLLDELRSFDSIVSWYGANNPAFRDTVAALGLPFSFLPALPANGVHATDFYLDQVRPISRSDVPAIPRIPCDAQRENFAVLHPFSGSPRKNWPIEKFCRLAARLERLMPVHWCVGPDDPPLPGAVHIDDLYQLACWLAKARLFVGNDSGITHLAAAVGTPVWAIFGPTDPRIWAPHGNHVRVVKAII